MLTKKSITRTICTLLVPALILSFGCFPSFASDGASRSVSTIVVSDVDNGDVAVTKTGKTSAEIKLSPSEGYLTADISLLSSKGKNISLEAKGNNVYTCRIPKKEAVLKVKFRRTRLVLSEEQLSMNKGDEKRVSARLEYIDGVPESRTAVKYSGVHFRSSDKSVASITKKGRITAKKKGFARIEAYADSGNNVSSFFYIIVDGNKEKAIGKLGLFAYFDANDFVNRTIFGHSFLVFENTSGRRIPVDIRGFFEINIPTEKYMTSYKCYDSNGYSLLSYYHPTNGEQASDSNEAVRRDYAASLFCNLRSPKKRFINPDNPVPVFRDKKYYVESGNGNVATFGNTAHSEDVATFDAVVAEITKGDFAEIVRENGLTKKVDKITGEFTSGSISGESFLKKIAAVAKEVEYDFNTGYNPMNGVGTKWGGTSLNYELDYQALGRDYKNNAACCVDVTRTQLDAMVDFIQYNNYFQNLGRNCTWVATDAWNLVTAYNPDYCLSPNKGKATKSLATPLWLKSNIKEKASELKHDKKIKFYVNGEKTVIQPEILTKDKKIPELVFETTKFTADYNALKEEDVTFKLDLTGAPEDSAQVYKKVLGSARIRVSEDGILTVRKKTPKGTYRVEVKASASENFDFLKSSITKVIAVKVK